MEKKKIAIVTDSGSSLPSESRTTVYNGGIVEVPFTITSINKNQGHRDWIDQPLSDEKRLEFIRDLNDKSINITTSQPNPESYYRAFMDIINCGVTEIAVVPISDKLSNSIGSAKIAAEEFDNRSDINIVVADCKTVSIGQGLLLAQADEENINDKFNNANELVGRIEELSKDLCVVQAFSDLDHLRRGGRIGRAESLIGGVLNIIPMIGVNADGGLEPIGKNRGWEKTRRSIIDYVSKGVGMYAVRLAAVHFDSNQFNNLCSDIEGRFNIANDKSGQPYQVLKCEQSSVISVHSGPGVIGLGALAIKNRK